jgi:hypothetical protein
MKNSKPLNIALIAACLPLFAGCMERQAVYRGQPAAQPSGEAVADEPPGPPPPQMEVVPVAPGSVTVWFWVPGAYEWRNHWVWVGGRWTPRPHPGAVWVAGNWERHGRHHVWVTGHWR